MKIAAKQTTSNNSEENTTIIAPNTFANALKMLTKISPSPSAALEAPFFTSFPILS